MPRRTSAPQTPPTVKLSVNVSEEIGSRLRQIAFDQRLSESSIVEVALGLLFRRSDGPSLGTVLRQHGATLRRKPHKMKAGK